MNFFHGTSLLTYSSEVPGVVSCLNAWEYNYIDKIQKKNFVPMMFHLQGGWLGHERNKPLHVKKDYGLKIFCGELICFYFVPMYVPHFFKATISAKKQQKFGPHQSWTSCCFEWFIKRFGQHLKK